jgi:predicted dehydrogenase
MNEANTQADVTRRQFLAGGSLATVMAMMGGVELRAQDQAKPADGATEYNTEGAPVKCALVGCGAWGREILKSLSALPNAPVVAVCDSYESAMRRAKESAPNAQTFVDYKEVLKHKDVQAVLVATPSHQHREIVIAALQAGKHVYCESPLAASIDDAKAIARAAHAAVRLNFQAGQSYRSDPQRRFLLPFVRSGAMGRMLMMRAQWHKKQSWRRTAATSEREQALNWRLRREHSPGLLGEIGVHQLDVATWFLNARPVAVTGFGGILHWADGRDVPDTVQAMVEYPGGVNLMYHCTLGNSFDADYEMYYATDGAIMLRQNKAWMFKEVDAPLLGWEVYARKDQFYQETGIALVANATKLAAQGDKPVEEAPYKSSPLFYALEAFVNNCHVVSSGVEDFLATFEKADDKALREYLAGLEKNRMPAAGYAEGYEAAVIALKANEAVLSRKRIAYEPGWFEI